MATTKTTTTTTAMTAGPVFDDFSDFVKIFQFSSGNGTAGIVTSGEGRRGEAVDNSATFSDIYWLFEVPVGK